MSPVPLRKVISLPPASYPSTVAPPRMPAGSGSTAPAICCPAGRGAGGKLITLRKGTGDMICLASDPRSPKFHAACYHSDMEPFMARGRALRASGVTGGQVDTVRFREVREGTLAMPRNPSAMFQIFGEGY